ncbi:hypothetical protein [Bacillus toyonensis]|nr:hypothetical protein [Bacillus toyonensis]MBU4643035.1 hypothetical protein [Bacillus toyonensis]
MKITSKKGFFRQDIIGKGLGVICEDYNAKMDSSLARLKELKEALNKI